MAKSEKAAVEGRARAAELKRELRQLVREITEEDDSRAETFEGAIAVLEDLKRVSNGGNGAKGKRCSPPSPYGRKKQPGSIEKVEVPECFLCPISSEIMRDPVLLSSGQTYDRPFIQERLKSGKRTCPKTDQVLSNLTLVPNQLVRNMILQWCSEQGITLPPIANQEEGVITKGERTVLNTLLEKISCSSILEHKQATRELRLLTKQNRSVRALLGENPDMISQLLSLLSMPSLSDDLEVKEDIVTTILNLSLLESNKKIIGDNSQAIPSLIEALNTGTMQSRANSAAALFSLSALDSYKIKIYESGALWPLLNLLAVGSLDAKKDAANAIFNLCMAHENKAKAVKVHIVPRILPIMVDYTLVDECLAILALLCSDAEAAYEIGEYGGVPSLLSIIKENSCGRNKENAIVILFSICMIDRKKLAEVREEETLNGTISQLAQNGTSRARRKATGVLERLKSMTPAAYHSC